MRTKTFGKGQGYVEHFYCDGGDPNVVAVLSGHFRSSGKFPQAAQKNATKHMILPVHCAASVIYPTLRLPDE